MIAAKINGKEGRGQNVSILCQCSCHIKELEETKARFKWAFGDRTGETEDQELP